MNELIKGIKELNKAIRYKLSKKYCPNQAPMSPSVVEILEKQAVLNDSLIKQLANVEYNHKVKVPPFMDEFLMFVKKNGDHGIDAYNNLFTICSSWPKEQILEWSFADPDRFLDAVRYGHEVEEEPKYYVAFPALEWNENKAELETKNMYLLHDETSDESNFSLSPRRVRDFVPELTEETIKALDERFWPFAVPVEEVNHDS